ncbi:MAG: DNA-3-methyladenine glycosylase I [Treponema sp.]|jgi:DNA-3-methyladenine glycosylase I|nr:DNA-3-methyladenine glycosylase I [Treponema sp.]
MKQAVDLEKNRCLWCLTDADYIKYHDKEWGKPLRNSKKLFEFLILDGAQAGLSWLTILKRRNGYREAFDGFDPEKMAKYGQKDIQRLLSDSRIIRNKLKISSAIGNAHAYLDMRESGQDFSKWLWNWVDGTPIINHWKTLKEIPASTDLSERISKELKRLGFTFVGPTIIYAFIQAAGLVNDHIMDCFRYEELSRANASACVGT